MLNLCFCIQCDLRVMYHMLVHSDRETSTHYFSWFGAPGAEHTNSAGTRYAELVVLHLMGSVGHVVCYVAYRARNIDALFFMLGCAQCRSHKQHGGTRYAELMFFNMVGSTRHVVHLRRETRSASQA
jgi:hypothetical protein